MYTGMKIVMVKEEEEFLNVRRWKPASRINCGLEAVQKAAYLS